jgi:bifunctional non-homologous end joining protein LigD
VATSSTVEVDGRQLALTNLEKVLYPAAGFTKAAVVDYYVRIAPIIVPHLRRRALTMVRWPDGVAGPSFFEKRCPPHAPDWVVTGEAEPDLLGCVVEDRATLVWVANLASLELHTKQLTIDDAVHPTSMVFDLDPGPPAGVLDCARVALELRDVLGELGLECVVKTSGGKGLHLNVPVRGSTADETKEFARALGQILERQDPTRITTVMRKDLRRDKVFVDWSQNDSHKTTVTAYSLRAQSRPTVSTPVAWDEVRDALDADDPTRLEFEAADVLERVDELGDLYEANLTLVQHLPDVGRR